LTTNFRKEESPSALYCIHHCAWLFFFFFKNYCYRFYWTWKSSCTNSIRGS